MSIRCSLHPPRATPAAAPRGPCLPRSPFLRCPRPEAPRPPLPELAPRHRAAAPFVLALGAQNEPPVCGWRGSSLRGERKRGVALQSGSPPRGSPPHVDPEAPPGPLHPQLTSRRQAGDPRGQPGTGSLHLAGDAEGQARSPPAVCTGGPRAMGRAPHPEPSPPSGTDAWDTSEPTPRGAARSNLPSTCVLRGCDLGERLKCHPAGREAKVQHGARSLHAVHYLQPGWPTRTAVFPKGFPALGPFCIREASGKISETTSHEEQGP